jgi:hypothetical protein
MVAKWAEIAEKLIIFTSHRTLDPPSFASAQQTVFSYLYLSISMHEMRHDLTQCTTIGTCADRKKFGYLKDDNGDVIGLGSSLGKPRSSSLEKKRTLQRGDAFKNTTLKLGFETVKSNPRC